MGSVVGVEGSICNYTVCWRNLLSAARLALGGRAGPVLGAVLAGAGVDEAGDGDGLVEAAVAVAGLEVEQHHEPQCHGVAPTDLRDESRLYGRPLGNR